MKIAGLDIGRGTACIAVLESFPTNIQKYFKKHRQDFIKLNADQNGLEKFVNYNCVRKTYRVLVLFFLD